MSEETRVRELCAAKSAVDDKLGRYSDHDGVTGGEGQEGPTYYLFPKTNLAFVLGLCILQGMRTLAHSSGAYDCSSREFIGVDHSSPDVLLADMDLNGVTALAKGLYVEASETPFASVTMLRRRDVWKTLVRYVWHNARSVTGACIYFGIAARHVDGLFEKHMLPAEARALSCETQHKFNRAQKLFQFRDGTVYRTWQAMEGYTPLSALLQGEHHEWRKQADEQERRRTAIKAILLAAWKDIQTRRMEPTLRNAFKNFTAITGEDRDLLAWVTQTEFGEAFIETRAAVCARRKRKVKLTLTLNGYTACTAPGGKSEGAIEKYSEAQKGNHNRAGSVGDSEDNEQEHSRAMHRELYDRTTGDIIPIRPDLPRDAKRLREFLKQQHEAAEARRLERISITCTTT